MNKRVQNICLIACFIVMLIACVPQSVQLKGTWEFVGYTDGRVESVFETDSTICFDGDGTGFFCRSDDTSTAGSFTYSFSDDHKLAIIIDGNESVVAYSIDPKTKRLSLDGLEYRLISSEVDANIKAEAEQTSTPKPTDAVAKEAPNEISYYTKPTESMVKNAAAGIVIAESVNMCKGPGKDYEIVRTDIAKGTEVTLYVEQDGWWFLKCGDQYGYIKKDYVQKSEALTIEIRESGSALYADKSGKLTVTGTTLPGATLTATSDNAANVLCGSATVDAEGNFSFQITTKDSFYGMSVITLNAEKEGAESGSTKFKIIKGFADKSAFVKYYSGKNQYFEISSKTKLDDLLANQGKYASNEYGFRITATVVDVIMIDGDTIVKMSVHNTDETVYVHNLSEKWTPGENVGAKYNIYCNFVGTYEDTGCCEFYGWVAKPAK